MGGKYSLLLSVVKSLQKIALHCMTLSIARIYRTTLRERERADEMTSASQCSMTNPKVGILTTGTTRVPGPGQQKTIGSVDYFPEINLTLSEFGGV